MKPAVAVMDSISDVMAVTRLVMRFNKRFAKDEVVLFEDLLEGKFRTFVSSKGEATSHGSEILDAFCHFTYQASGQKLVFSNLRGVEEEEQPDHFILTEPVVHSVDSSFGESDRSVAGICDFFKNHVCSSLCKDFSKPSDFVNKCPSAPFLGSDDSTISKEAEVASHAQANACRLPVYEANDPNGPPPYVAH